MFSRRLFTSSVFETVQTISKVSKMPMIPLTETFPGAEKIPKETIVSSLNRKTMQSTLSNGLKVVSQDAVGPGAMVGIFVQAGCRFENEENEGVSNFVEKLVLGSTKPTNSIVALHKSETKREHLVCSFDSFRDFVPDMMAQLSEMIRNPDFSHSSMESTKDYFKQLIPIRQRDSKFAMDDALYHAAYNGRTIGRPLEASAKTLENISADKVESYFNKYFIPSRFVLVGAGVEHNVLLELAEKHLGQLKASGNSAINNAEAINYTGGHKFFKFEHQLGLNHIMLGWKSASWSHDDLLPLCVLNMMMGGGGSFSSGGPGKGMFTRMYENILNRAEYIYHANALNEPFSDSGLFNFYIQCYPDMTKDAIVIGLAEAIKMTHQPTDDEFKRAKIQLQSMIKYNLENRALLFEDIGTQVIATGKRMTPEELTYKIEKIQPIDVTNVAKKLFNAPVSYVVSGEDPESHALSYEQVKKLLVL